MLTIQGEPSAPEESIDPIKGSVLIGAAVGRLGQRKRSAGDGRDGRSLCSAEVAELRLQRLDAASGDIGKALRLLPLRFRASELHPQVFFLRPGTSQAPVGRGDVCQYCIRRRVQSVQTACPLRNLLSAPSDHVCVVAV
ncbi:MULTISPECIES: hypothetical protein [Streptomyces]|uniref:hypothetical protein n=1 Tax=Streptomyces lycopersici TaxID=2974589 RepID=UPI0021D2AAFE|nr:hypothetical protein [Streptomyces sp. NEAU-383]